MRGLVARASALTTRPLVCQQRYNEERPAFSQGSKLHRASMSNSRQLKQGMWPVSLTCLPEGLSLSLAHTWLPLTPCSEVIHEVVGDTHITLYI